METSDLQNIHAATGTETAGTAAAAAGTDTAKRKYTRRAAGKNGRKVRGAKAVKVDSKGIQGVMERIYKESSLSLLKQGISLR